MMFYEIIFILDYIVLIFFEEIIAIEVLVWSLLLQVEAVQISDMANLANNKRLTLFSLHSTFIKCRLIFRLRWMISYRLIINQSVAVDTVSVYLFLFIFLSYV